MSGVSSIAIITALGLVGGSAPALSQDASTLDMRAMRFGGDIYLTVGGSTPDSDYGYRNRLIVSLDSGSENCTADVRRAYEGPNSESVYDSDFVQEAVEPAFFMYLQTSQTGSGRWRACAVLDTPSGAVSKTVFVQMPQRCSGVAQRIIGGRRGEFVRLALTGASGATCADGRNAVRLLLAHWRKHRSGPLLEQRSRGEDAGYMYFYGPTPLRGSVGASVIYNRLGFDVGRFSVTLPGVTGSVDITEYHAPAQVHLAICRTPAQRRSTTCR